MQKELLTIEFRYNDVPKGDWDTSCRTKKITLGVFDTFEEAIVEGNKALEVFEKHFKLNTAWNEKRRFSKNGGCFGTEERLISQLAYLQTPFDFYARIEKLNYEGVEETIMEALEATKKYREYKSSNNSDE